METRMSQLSKYELEMLITKLSEQKRKAEQHGNVSEVEVVTRKIAIAKSYLIDPARFERGAFTESKEKRHDLIYTSSMASWVGDILKEPLRKSRFRSRYSQERENRHDESRTSPSATG